MRVLQSCPCCGSKARLMTGKTDFNKLVATHGSACVSIECTNRGECGLTMFCHYKSKDYETMIEKAAEQWNRRVANG